MMPPVVDAMASGDRQIPAYQEYKGEIPRLNKESKNGEVSEWLPQASEAGDKGEHAWRATQPQAH